MAFLKTLFDGNEREVNRLRKSAERVNALEPQISALTDEQLAGKTVEFRERLAAGETVDALLPATIARFRAAGYTFVTVSELVRRLGRDTLNHAARTPLPLIRD